MSEAREKVVVAMSGGVDSSVAAALLRQEGHEVHGVTFAFDPFLEGPDLSWCCGAGAAEQAGAVAERIGATHEVVECADLFEAVVLWPAWRDYSCGRTPNPCVACNRQVKFDLLLEHAGKIDAARIATGHYARLADSRSNTRVLRRARDRNKDQSYFLFTLTEEQRAAALFPLGELEKTRVRRIARELGFENADREESQDACFRSPCGFAEGLRLKFEAEPRPGTIVDREGREVGSHRGIHHFTIGQRKGTGVSLGSPAYVVEIDGAVNRIVLSTREEDILARGLRAAAVVWAEGAPPGGPLRCLAQIRYRHREVPAVVHAEDRGGVDVRFEEPQRAVTPGQAVVFYDGDRVLGGGWIERALGRDEAGGD
jgi:tRNA-specific 2-thiouridylase